MMTSKKGHVLSVHVPGGKIEPLEWECYFGILKTLSLVDTQMSVKPAVSTATVRTDIFSALNYTLLSTKIQCIDRK